jgi:hypothetical protein
MGQAGMINDMIQGRDLDLATLRARHRGRWPGQSLE